MAGLFQQIYGLFQPSEEELRANQVQGLFGSPTRVEGTMQSAEFDEQGNEINQRFTQSAPQLQAGTGLFTGLESEQIPQMQAIQQMVSSTDENMQKTGLSMLEDFQGDGLPTASDYLDARVNAYGAPVVMVDGKNVNAGKMQRALIDAQGNPDWKGTAYDPRQQFVSTGTELTNVARPDETIAINLAQAQFNKKQGEADFKFLDNYGVNVDKGESSLEAMDFLTTGLDSLVEGATGWSTGWGSFLKDVPESDAGSWKAMQTTVLSGLGLDKMAELKSLSSTGSTGFGALNEAELELLVSYRGKLEQANDAKTIKKIIKNMQRLIGSARKRTVRRLTNAKKRFDKLAPSRGYETEGVTPQANNLEPATKPTRVWGQ